MGSPTRDVALEEKMAKIIRNAVEIDPTGKGAHEPGAKLDHGKSPVHQGVLKYFPRALMAIAKVSEYGAGKYSWNGWRSVPDGYTRYSNAMERHICKREIEGPHDLEVLNDPKYPGKLLHDAQVAWNALARLELWIEEQEKIDWIDNAKP